MTGQSYCTEDQGGITGRLSRARCEVLFLAGPFTSGRNHRLPMRCRYDQDIFASWSHLDLSTACASDLSHSSGTDTKQTGDIVYSEARRRRFHSFWASTKMLYALERESDLRSTFAVFVELSERGDVSTGSVP